MGAVPSKVVHGVPVGWLPSAAVLVRRSACSSPAFEPGLRVGEDVDLFWRMDETGWTVRYAPHVLAYHEVRLSWKDFVSRRAMYGKSAAHLEKRHPGRLTPASPSVSGLAVLAALSTGHPVVATAVAAYELARQRAIPDAEVPLPVRAEGAAHSMRSDNLCAGHLLRRDRCPVRSAALALPPPVVAEVAGHSMGSDNFWAGHLLRRDWWPVGWAVLALTPRSRLARGVAAAMMWEPVRDHLLAPTRLDPVRSLGMRLLDDASYGSGVIRNAIRQRVPAVVTPRPRLPLWPTRSGDA